MISSFSGLEAVCPCSRRKSSLLASFGESLTALNCPGSGRLVVSLHSCCFFLFWLTSCHSCPSGLVANRAAISAKVDCLCERFCAQLGPSEGLRSWSEFRGCWFSFPVAVCFVVEHCSRMVRWASLSSVRSLLTSVSSVAIRAAYSSSRACCSAFQLCSSSVSCICSCSLQLRRNCYAYIQGRSA